MSEDFGKDMLMLGGTVIGFIAALLTLMEKLLDVKNRLKSLTSKKDRSSSSTSERQASDPPPAIDFFSSKPFRDVSYLLLYESSVIVAAGLLLNYVGLTLSRHLEIILFLDMTGTALVAFLLGPAAFCPLPSHSLDGFLSRHLQVLLRRLWVPAGGSPRAYRHRTKHFHSPRERVIVPN